MNISRRNGRTSRAARATRAARAAPSRPGRRRRRILLVPALISGYACLAACLEPAGGRAPGGQNEGWEITVYYTAVERFHEGTPPTVVRGCRQRECSFGTDLLGTFPAGFVQAVRDEGTGRITSAPLAGSMLNWSYDTGFWLDDIPSDTAGRALVPFRSAAADSSVLPAGTTFVIEECGVEEDGSEIDPSACEVLRRTSWEIRDEFTPGLGGEQHLDLYIGEENIPDFTEKSPLYLTGIGAGIRVTEPRQSQ
ncbi:MULTISPECIES: hypothetical protein [Parafrankia]|uniref:hypothetical protein n=1 Tax=Parafrankia TaxID=2994362 RepID=UPI001F61E135|nr:MULTISPECIES: hypothetical protein [Parafrankia]